MIRRTFQRTCAVVIASLLCAGAVTSCASSAKTEVAAAPSAKATPKGGDLYLKARASALAATSVHIKGDLTDGGERVQLDVAGLANGDEMGTIGLSNEPSFELRRVASVIYIRGGSAYWTKTINADAARSIGDKYVKLPVDAAKALDSLGVSGLLKKFFENGSVPSFANITTKVTSANVNGQAAWLLTDRFGGDGAKFYVSADGNDRVLRVATASSKQGGAVDFSEWDAVPPITAPAAGQIATMPGAH